MKRFATNPFPEKEIFRHDRDVRFQGSTERLAHARIIRIDATSGIRFEKPQSETIKKRSGTLMIVLSILWLFLPSLSLSRFLNILQVVFNQR